MIGKNKKTTFMVYLASGQSFPIKAKNCKISWSKLDGSLTSYNFEGTDSNQFIWINPSQIVAVVEVK